MLSLPDIWFNEDVTVHADEPWGHRPAQVRMGLGQRKMVATIEYGYYNRRVKGCPAVVETSREICPLWEGHDGLHIRCSELLMRTVDYFVIVSMRSVI